MSNAKPAQCLYCGHIFTAPQKYRNQSGRGATGKTCPSCKTWHDSNHCVVAHRIAARSEAHSRS